MTVLDHTDKYLNIGFALVNISLIIFIDWFYCIKLGFVGHFIEVATISIVCHNSFAMLRSPLYLTLNWMSTHTPPPLFCLYWGSTGANTSNQIEPQRVCLRLSLFFLLDSFHTRPMLKMLFTIPINVRFACSNNWLILYTVLVLFNFDVLLVRWTLVSSPSKMDNMEKKKIWFFFCLVTTCHNLRQFDRSLFSWTHVSFQWILTYLHVLTYLTYKIEA